MKRTNLITTLAAAAAAATAMAVAPGIASADGDNIVDWQAQRLSDRAAPEATRGPVALAEQLGVEPGQLSFAELVALRAAREDGDQSLERHILRDGLR